VYAFVLKMGEETDMEGKMKLKYIIFITTTIVTVATLLLFWGICNQKFSSLITEQVVDDYQEITVAMEKNVETLSSYTQDFAKYMSLDTALRDTLSDYYEMSPEEWTKNRLSMQKQWEDISIRLIYSTSRLAGVGIYVGKEPLYSYFNSSFEYDTDMIPGTTLQEAEMQKKALWTDLLTLRNTSSYKSKPEYVFAVVKLVQGAGGEKLGTIVVFVRESSFSEVIAKEDTQNRQFYLVNEDGQIISAENKEALYHDVKEELDLSDEQYQSCRQDGKMLLQQKGSAPVLYMSSEIEGTGWHLIGKTVLEELDAQQQGLRTFMKMMLILAGGLTILVSWFISKKLTKPLNELILVMRKIESGQNKEKLRFSPDGIGEMGLLGQEFNRLMDKVDESAEQIYQEQRQRRHNEVRLLQAQIVPHFLYNTLGMITSLIKLERSSEALRAIQNLVTFYRLSLSTGKEKITVKEELELTDNYLMLYQMRYIEYVEYRISSDESAATFMIPKLTIQPLVENVLQHGLKPNGEKCVIIIKAERNQESEGLVVSVCDNGCGIAPERLAKLRQSLKTGNSLTNSFGVLNVNQRLELMYGKEFHMEIESVEQAFTKFSLYLPKREWE